MLQGGAAYYIEHPDRLNRETLYDLRMVVARCPYCQTARLLLLNNLYLLHDAQFGAELRKAALYVGDRRTLFYLFNANALAVNDDEEALAEPGIDRTLSLIDAFLSSLPEERTSLNIATDSLSDYASVYLVDTDDEDDGFTDMGRMRGQELIDRFVSGESERIEINPNLDDKPEQEEVDEVLLYGNDDEEPVGVEEEFFTETLAHIYIKQKKYHQALKIIQKLYLEYPNKNRYFADQIRFLEKIITNIKIE